MARTPVLNPPLPLLSPWQMACLWTALVVPSVPIVSEHAGGLILAAYIAVATAAVLLGGRLPVPTTPRGRRWAAVLTGLAVVVAFVVVYPRVNVHLPHMGSDDDDALDIGVRALWGGHSPYGERTYLGNMLHQLPGAFLLAAPFVALGGSAIGNLFWLLMCFLAVRDELRRRDPAEFDAQALRLTWVVLIACPVVIDEVVTGTGHGANAIYVLLGLWWLTRTERPALASAVWGVALASRPNFLTLVPIGVMWVRRRWGNGTALLSAVLAVGVAAALTLPFYFSDPAGFGPSEGSTRLTDFDDYLPHASVLILGAIVVVALWCTAKVDAPRTVFSGSALVLATPVILGTAIALAFQWWYALGFPAYGLFATWFVLMWLATAAPNGDAKACTNVSSGVKA